MEITMEDGGLVAEAGWAEFDMLSHGGEESEEVMAQLLGAFRSHGEEGRHVLSWCDQAFPDAYGDGSLAVPLAYDGCCYLGDSDEAPLGSSSCAAPGAQEEHGAAEYLDVAANHPLLEWCGNGDPGREDLDDLMGIGALGSVSAASNKSKRKKVVEEHDGRGQTQPQTGGRKRARNEDPRRARKSGDEDPGMAAIASCCTSDSDSNASLESADADARRPNGNNKARAAEPQSIYARKRRERINERLKVLQSLVPNGTKVDISTMLEEAVRYVKFLQLQIRLLSSDDTWMYAPIAYNGMGIGIR